MKNPIPDLTACRIWKKFDHHSNYHNERNSIMRDIKRIYRIILVIFIAFEMSKPQWASAQNKSEKEESVYDEIGEWSIDMLDGRKVEFSQFKGQVVFLNIWSTWCLPCRREMPNIQNLYAFFKDRKDIGFILISDEKAEAVNKFIKKMNYNFPVYIQNGDFPDVFNSRSRPLTYILDRHGIVVYKHIGSARWDDESIRNFLLELAK